MKSRLNSSQTSSTKQLGFWTCAALVAGNMIGSGIFLLPASLASFGGIAMLGWLFTTVGAILLALTFGYLARAVPRTGGIYAYSRAGFGDFIGFQVAWGYWIAIWAANAAIAVAFTGYLSAFLPVLSQKPMLGGAVSVGVIWLLTGVNLFSIRQAGKLQVLVTILKILPLVAIALIGPFYVDLDHFKPFNPSGMAPLSGLTAAAALTLWAYLGLEAATIPAQHVPEPEKTIPRATIAGTLLAAVLYIGGSFAVMGIVPPETLSSSTSPFADAARTIGGDWAGVVMVWGALAATFGALNGWVLLSGHIPLAAAQDGLFPRFLGRVSKDGIPVSGIIVSGVMATAIAILNYSENLVDQFTFIILLSTLTTLVPYVFSAMAAVLIQISDQNSLKPGFLLITGSAFLYALWAIAGAGAEAVHWGFILMTGGIPVYVYMKYQAKR